MDLTFDTLDLEHDGGWLTVWFNDPARRNPLSVARVDDLLRLCDALHSSDLRGVSFRGRGGVFCAGADLSLLQGVRTGALDADGIAQLSRDGARLFDAVAALPQITVTVAEGAVMAGGLGLACCTDLVLATPECRFALTEVRVGLVAAQIAPFVQARIGARAARRLMVLGASLEAEGAVATGLVDQVLPADDLAAALAQIRRDAAAAAPGAVAATKALLADLPSLSREAQITRAARDFAQALLSAEGREGVGAFAEKRAPFWKDAPC